MPSVVCIGTGEAFDPALPNNSLFYRGSINLLIDCGFAVPQAFFSRVRDPSLLDAIYITHHHADHAFGLPAVLLWMKEEGRTRPLELIGGPGLAEYAEKLMTLAYPGSFEDCYPIIPVELTPGRVLKRGSAELRNARSSHRVRNLALRIDDLGRSFCHSGDGAPTPETLSLYRRANLLSHECYFAEQETESHAHFAEVLALAEVAHVETLMLTHLGRKEKERIHQLAMSTPRKVIIPKPGAHIHI
ncbi:MAG TPA: ribonuclease Z [Polyangiaceae bacterium]|nr:ribonuclease Z [Polyangiaceae bacterium]